MSDTKPRTYYLDTDVDTDDGLASAERLEQLYGTFSQPKVYALYARVPRSHDPDALDAREALGHLVAKLQGRADMNVRTAHLHSDWSARLESRAKADAYRNAVADVQGYVDELSCPDAMLARKDAVLSLLAGARQALRTI